MYLRLCGWLMAAMLLTAGCASTPSNGTADDVSAPQVKTAAPMDLDGDLARLSEWFAGEWDNYEQVYLEKEAAADASIKPSHERIHLLFRPVDVPALEGRVFFARQTLDDDPSRLFRVRLYHFVVDKHAKAIRLDQYSFLQEAAWRNAHLTPEKFGALTIKELKYSPDCAVYFQRQARNVYRGSTVTGACTVESERLGKSVILEDHIELGAETLSILSSARDESGKLIYGNVDGVPHRHRKVRFFDGWIVIYRGDRTANPNAKERNTMRNVVLHSEGRVVPVIWEDGRRSGYSLQLARLSYQNEKMHLLTLKLLDDATGQAVSYAWADPSTQHIGLNLQWFQTGLTQRPGDARFDPKPALSPPPKPR